MNDLIRPFRINIPQSERDELRDRLGRVRWPDLLEGIDPADRTRGIPAAELAELVEHWRSSYDWAAQETILNALQQFTTEIDGQRIHFAHVRSSRADAVPLLMLHGYPSSFAEFGGMVGGLVEPRMAPPSMWWRRRCLALGSPRHCRRRAGRWAVPPARWWS